MSAPVSASAASEGDRQQSPAEERPSEWVTGVIDLGSNSVRLMLVRIRADGSYRVLNQVKHMIRLGAGSFARKRLREDAMRRALDVLRGLADMCAVYGTREVTAIATAAVRDADNGADFLRRVREKTGLVMTAVSGQEEARLIYLGVSSGLETTDRPRLFIDIGGGSTELIVGDSAEFRNLDSLRLGCVRLTNRFFGKDDGPVSADRYAALQNIVRREAVHALQRIRGFDIVEAVASSGTAQNLAEMAAAFRRRDAGKEEDEDAARADLRAKFSRRALTYDDLLRVVRELCARGLEERRKLPGINPDRADVIVAGAAVLQTIMEELGLTEVRVSGRSLQHGILIDYLRRRGLALSPAGAPPHLSTREAGVLGLARFCRFEEEHARHVAALALELFDSARARGLHAADPGLRELLYYAALLHDIGIFLSFTAHHMHAHYLIRHTELLGFTDREIEIMAATAFFHRKRPTRRYPEYRNLDKESKAAVRLLSLFLTLAERMDKSHAGLVLHAHFAAPRPGGGKPELRLLLRGDRGRMELEEVERTGKLLRRRFDRNIRVTAERTNAEY